uniref:Uncharacterized protein n=1 Tax=Romanomermis culicivorax TaxID=13658 RepID=A0A915KJW1_ROMCU
MGEGKSSKKSHYYFGAYNIGRQSETGAKFKVNFATVKFFNQSNYGTYYEIYKLIFLPSHGRQKIEQLDDRAAKNKPENNEFLFPDRENHENWEITENFQCDNFGSLSSV